MHHDFVKDPDAVLDYQWDWTDWLAEGDTISSHEVVVEEGDVIVDSSLAANGVVTVWLSGGTPFSFARVRARVETSQGRTDDRSAVFKVWPR